ncbi:MAG: hypothetical protein B6A08_09590 [Sorangiineae bacterium NIC37A_2]|jgi:phosphoribosylanthranilate isomerase|nr:MAG: hypothetical protein B6A08_09590 [Sorangiineae bacterium NIC37A_2]
MASLWIKICGVTREEDAREVVRLGADAIGLNFVQSSPRFVSRERAAAIMSSVPDAAASVEWVGVFAGMSLPEVVSMARELKLDRVQLHGDEDPSFVAALLAEGLAAYRALRIQSEADLAGALEDAGDRLLVDAKVDGVLGGTGHSFDPALVTDLARKRPLVVAGGLRPDNVARVVRFVRPFGVDTASGVESSPGQKDLRLVRAFIEQARAGSIGEGSGSEIGS